MDISAGAEKLSDFFPMEGPQYYYVDKTGLIKDMISAGFLDAFPMLILRPRRFGKTLALSMLKTFFDINEADKAWIFSNLAISQDTELCERHQNKYPVISISFKDIEGSSYDQLLYKMNLKLKREAQKHKAAIISEMAFDGKPRDILYDEADRDKLLRIIAEKGTEMDLMGFLRSLPGCSMVITESSPWS